MGQVGSVHVIADATGTPVTELTYDRFGNVVEETNPTFGDRFRFTRRELDEATGLSYDRARYYSPSLGTFISQHPAARLIGIGACSHHF